MFAHQKLSQSMVALHEDSIFGCGCDAKPLLLLTQQSARVSNTVFQAQRLETCPCWLLQGIYCSGLRGLQGLPDQRGGHGMCTSQLPGTTAKTVATPCICAHAQCAGHSGMPTRDFAPICLPGSAAQGEALRPSCWCCDLSAAWTVVHACAVQTVPATLELSSALAWQSTGCVHA